MGRLSSGYKINKAGDNPAGMAISSKMKAQIDGLNQAEANSDDGQSVLRIADGALNEVSNMLQRIRELSVQAANGTNSYSDRQSIQDEIDQLTQEVDRISTDTEYNKKTLLDGSANTLPYLSTFLSLNSFCIVYFCSRYCISKETATDAFSVEAFTVPVNAVTYSPIRFSCTSSVAAEITVVSVFGSATAIFFVYNFFPPAEIQITRLLAASGAAAPAGLVTDGVFGIV